jgi:hypothetical protein
VAPETKDFTAALEMLDPRLALVKNPNGSWSIYRHPENGAPPVHIMRSKPGAKLSPGVIAMLRSRDTRAGHDPIGEIIAHNDKVQKDATDKAVEQGFVAFDTMMSKAWSGIVPKTDEGIEAAI